MRVQLRLPLLVLAAALALVFHRLLMGEVLFWGLPSLQFYPWREYAFDLVRNGQLPLWNPYNGAGAPLFANYQSSLLYPLSWLGVVLPLAITMSFTAVFHLFLAGWGMWRFTGELKFSLLGRGISALAFGMTAYLVARLGTYPIVQAAAWLPWMLWVTVRLLESGRPRSGGLLALFTALLLLAGHAQTAWYCLLLVGLFALWWTVFGSSAADWKRRWLRLALAAGCMALGAGIAALQLVATAELLGQSQRSGGVDFDFAMNFSYAPARVLNLFAANAFGTPANGTYITGGAFFEDAVYIGIIPLVGAIAALVGWLVTRRQAARPDVYRTTPFWLLVVLVGFVFALGVNTPVFPFLYNNAPTFDLFQAPVRWHLWTVFALSVLAGLGATAWGRSRRLRQWTKRALVACAAATLLALVFLIFAPSDVRAVGLLTQALIALGVLGIIACVLALTQPEAGTRGHTRWVLVVLVVTALDLTWAGWGLNPTAPERYYAPNRPDATEVQQTRSYWTESAEETVKFEQFFRFDNYETAVTNWREARASQLPNMNLIDRLPLLNNFEPLLVGHFADMIELIEANPAANAPLRAAGVQGLYNPTFATLEQEARRAWLLRDACWHETEDALKAAMVDPAWLPERQVQLLGDGGCAASSDLLMELGTVEFTESGANRVTMSVNAPQDSWLVLADTDYPGWEARVDGVETPIYRANLAFRAVQVDAGQHEVSFEYHPRWLLAGALVSAISLLIALLLYRLGA
jgi:hypothetical protein